MAVKMLAEKILELNGKWINTDKVVVLYNIEETLHKSEVYSGYTVQQFLEKVTGAKFHTAYAWVNISRPDVKIPLLKLCAAAKELGVDIETFFEENSKNYQKCIDISL